MLRHPALIDSAKGGYGVVFPGMDSVVAMGSTLDVAIRNAEASLKDYARTGDKRGEQSATPSAPEDVEMPAGSTLTTIPLTRPGGKPMHINLFVEESTLAFIDGEAKRRGMTVKTYIGWMADRVAEMGR